MSVSSRRRSVAAGIAASCLILASLVIAGCGATTTGAAAASPTTAPTATPVPPCEQFVPGSVAFTSLSGVAGLQLPAGSYISATPAVSGGGAGQYTIKTYTVCFHGSEAAIDGANPSAIGSLVQAGWTLNNLFPDPTSFSYIDYCSNAHLCVNNAGSPDPFTFVGFEQYANHTGGYTTVHLDVATIAAPSCLNDPQYYSGTPKYRLYYDGNSTSVSGDPSNHFLMPPGTRVSTFQGGGTAGSTYVYYCSAGTQATVVSFLKQAMQNVGWTISNAAASGFTASRGQNPTYTIAVSVQNPNNYYLRVFIPM